MEKAEQGVFYDSSKGRLSELNSDGSRQMSPSNFPSGAAVGAGEVAGPKQATCDYLLSLLQASIGDVKDAGINVRVFQRADGTAILLEGVLLCQSHAILHVGPKCPMCTESIAEALPRVA